MATGTVMDRTEKCCCKCFGQFFLFIAFIYFLVRILLNVLIFIPSLPLAGAYLAIVLCALVLFWCCYRRGPQMFLGRRKWILKTNIDKPNDLFRNIASMIPNEEKVDYLEEKALVYLKWIKEALESRFNYTIRFVASGSIPERFGVPLVDYWIDNIGKSEDRHALLADQDFLIQPCEITASYSSQPNAIEIVQSESCFEEGFAKLKVNESLARKYNLKEGFLSTDVIKDSVSECLPKDALTHFPGVPRRNQGLLESLIASLICRKVKVHGPAVNLSIKPLDDSKEIFLADFTFAIPCLEWPPESDWSSRNRMWPDRKVVATITQYCGFHFVPRSKENDKSKLTWRYSFSAAERELSKHVNKVARICFLCLKIISTDHLKPICNRLRSYHFKTVFFHTLENTPASIWNENNNSVCLDHLLQAVQRVFYQRKCMHFWIKHINLFQNFNGSTLSKLGEKVKKIRKNPFPFLFSYSAKVMLFSQPRFKKQEMCCCCFQLVRDDEYVKVQIENSRIRNSRSEEVSPEEGNQAQVPLEEEVALKIDNNHVSSYESFSQAEKF